MPLVASNGAARSIYTRGYRYVFGVQSSAESELQRVLDMAATMNPGRPGLPCSLQTTASRSRLPAPRSIMRPDSACRWSTTTSTRAGRPTSMRRSTQRRPRSRTSSSTQAISSRRSQSPRRPEMFALMRPSSRIPRAQPPPYFAQALGKDANYVYSGSQWSPQLQYKQPYSLLAAQFAAEYQKKAGTNAIPAYQVASATAAGLALQRAIERADSLDQRQFATPLRHSTWSHSSAASSSTNTARTSPRRWSSSRFRTASWQRSGRQRWPRRLPCTQLPPGRRVRRSRYRRNRRRRPRSSAFHLTDLQ